MKKSLLVVTLLTSGILLTGCNFFGNVEDTGKKPIYYTTCEASGGYITGGEYGNVCQFDDGSFCYATTFLEGKCKKGEKFEDEKASDGGALNCSHDFDPVCGADGQMYLNYCYLERQGLMQSKDLVPSNGACVPAENGTAE